MYYVRSLMQRLSSKELPESGVNSTTEVKEYHGVIYPGLASFVRCDVSVLEEQTCEEGEVCEWILHDV